MTSRHPVQQQRLAHGGSYERSSPYASQRHSSRFDAKDDDYACRQWPAYDYYYSSNRSLSSIDSYDSIGHHGKDLRHTAPTDWVTSHRSLSHDHMTHSYSQRGCSHPQ